jgi:hypothetical protein
MLPLPANLFALQPGNLLTATGFAQANSRPDRRPVWSNGLQQDSPERSSVNLRTTWQGLLHSVVQPSFAVFPELP